MNPHREEDRVLLLSAKEHHKKSVCSGNLSYTCMLSPGPDMTPTRCAQKSRATAKHWVRKDSTCSLELKHLHV